jgi:hypothetical protein
MVVSSKSAETIRDELCRHIHEDDKLIVFKVESGTDSEAAWQNLPKDVADWLLATLK